MSEAISAHSSPLWMRVIFGKNPNHTLARMIMVIIVSLVAFKFLFLPIRIEGRSMEPTYRDGRLNLVNQLAYVRARPQRGDVVAIRSANDRILILKRVIGLPGDTVELIDGMVKINGEAIDEPYVRIKGKDIRPPGTLDEDHYFVIGDNRNVTDYGEIRFWRIVGKVIF
jgi:signal peptidase I